MPITSILVVGGGLLGASIVRSLSDREIKVTWLLGTKTNTASTDYNKIIRTPYPDEHYVKLAEEAMIRWKASGCFHNTGWVQAISEGSLRSTRKTPRDIPISTDEYQAKVGSIVPPGLSEQEELWLNPNIGYADTAHALELVVREMAALGVDVRTVDARKILKNEKGGCRGVEVDVRVPYEILADKTIVSAGPWTPKLLQTSAVPYPKGVIKVVGVVVGTLHLDENDKKSLNLDMPMSVGEHGEVMISKRHSLLKMTTTSTFEVENLDELENHTEARDKSANLGVLHKWFPQFQDKDIVSWVCPDLLTEDGRFIIDEAPETENLIIASGGSFHSGKFLPNFGDLVRQFLGEGDRNLLYDAILEGCKWDRVEGKQHVHPAVVPKALK